jgi:hypothetical protein
MINWTYDRLVQKAESIDTDAELGYGILTLAGSGSASRESFKRFQQTYLSNRSSSVRKKHIMDIFQHTVNPSAVAAWKDCMSGKKLLSYSTGDANRGYAIYITYTPKDASDPDFITITSSMGENIKLKEGFFTGPRIAPQATIRKHSTLIQYVSLIDPKAPGSLSLDFDGEAPHVTFDLPQVRIIEIERVRTRRRADVPIKTTNRRYLPLVAGDANLADGGKLDATSTLRLTQQDRTLTIRTSVSVKERGGDTRFRDVIETDLYTAPSGWSIDPDSLPVASGRRDSVMSYDRSTNGENSLRAGQERTRRIYGITVLDGSASANGLISHWYFDLERNGADRPWISMTTNGFRVRIVKDQ